MDYKDLRAKVLSRFPELPIEALDAAYVFAERMHKGQTRYSGEPYIEHPVAATDILLDLGPDLATLQACLLHDTTEDTSATVQDIEAEFGAEVARLVQGCEKLAVVKVKKDIVDVQGDQWRKLFLAMAEDVRIVFIKLADRLHNLRTLHHVPVEKQRRIAQESLMVHAAIASRLGIYRIKSEMQDLCFKFLYPEDFAKVSIMVAQHQQRSEACMAFAQSQLEQLLLREGVVFDEVQGRMKHLWSIYEKLREKEAWDLNEVYDLFAVRVIVPDHFVDGQEQVGHLYSILGLLHHYYIPLQDRFKDYIAVPKPNGYRSLHTTVLGMGGDLYDEPTEIQIRTQSMHKAAEIGIASHTEYKLGQKIQGDPKVRRALNEALDKVHALIARKPELDGVLSRWLVHYQDMEPDDRRRVEGTLREQGFPEEDLEAIRKGRSQGPFSMERRVEQQMAWLRGLAEDGVARLELDLYPDKIFVLTPGREVIQLKKGSTPVDFAYAVHTELGNKMVHAKVNGRVVPLDYALRNGEVVEIVTRNSAKPSLYWISIAQTNSARSKIKNWFNKQDREGNVQLGRQLLNEQLQLLGKPLLDERLSLLKDYAGKSRDFQEREQLLEALALGSTTVAQLVKTLFPGETLAPAQVAKPKATEGQLTFEVLVTGEEDLPVVLSACCKPKPPAPIIGYVARGRSIRIHRQSCSSLGGLEGERFVSAHWKGE